MYGRKVKLADALEWLFQAAATEALGPSWAVVPKFVEDFNNKACSDIFDFFLIQKSDFEQNKSVLVQVTHYPEEQQVEEEPNKTYEALETFEEFAYIKALALAGETKFVSSDTAVVHVLYGNKRRIRSWAISLFESLLDLCIYPHYLNGRLDSLPMYNELEDIAKSIRDAVTAGRVPRGREYTCLQLMKHQNSLPESVLTKYERITRQLRTFVDAGCPTNTEASKFWRARLNYVNSEEFKIASDNLESQLRQLPPSQRQWVKESVVNGAPFPPKASEVSPDDLKEITAINEMKNPFNKVASEFMANYDGNCSEIATRTASACSAALRALWQERDQGKRNFFRPFLFAVAGLRADDYLGLAGVGEQTIYLADLPEPATSAILRELENAFPTGREDIFLFLLRRKSVVRDLIRNKRWNGTRVDPVGDYLNLLLERELRKGSISRLEKPYEVQTILHQWLRSDLSRKPSTYPEHSTSLGKRAASIRFEFGVPSERKTCLIKTKSTKNEQNRRSKEEGMKGWLVKCTIEQYGISFNEKYKLMILLDGNWYDPCVMRRLAQCGWHVYFDAKDLVRDVVEICSR